MDISACPVCGTMDIRMETTNTASHKVVSWRSGESRPVFVASEDVVDSTSTKRVVCVNGHAHPDRVGFDLEWDIAPTNAQQVGAVSSDTLGV